MNLKFAVPRIMLHGLVTAGVTLDAGQPVNAGYGFVLIGMDAYPTQQPNNGDLIVTAGSTGPGIQAPIIWQIQQSQNFPGPFAWRGLLPIYDNPGVFAVTSTVPFNFQAWGVQLPRWISDSLMEF